MSEKEKKIPVPSSLTESHYHTQTEMLQVSQKKSQLSIGMPKEIALQENRIALVPSSVSTLIANGHRIVMETEAGGKTNIPDHDFAEAGVEIVQSAEEVYKADVIVKVAPPTLKEIDLLLSERKYDELSELASSFITLREELSQSFGTGISVDDEGYFTTTTADGTAAGL